MLIFAACMWLLNQYFPLLQLISSPWNRLGFAVMAGAFLLDLSSLFLFIKRHTTANPFSPRKARHLVTTGMYRYTRNPMYVGLTILLTGWGIYLGSLSPFLLIPFFVVVLTVQQIIPEEKVLEELFSEQYLEYKKTVRRWL
jgi:protein-S-isoprenylcysteine O-methyltransferase Ste14